MYKFGKLIFLSLIGLIFTSCTNHTEIKYYPINNMDGVIEHDGVAIDLNTSSNGNGALLLKSKTSKTFKLYETGDIDIENSAVTYEASVKTKDVKGKVYIEMWCHFKDKGEFFSRSLQNTLSGTQEWTSLKTPFFLKENENPDNIKLNIVIEGSGQIWVDNIRLTANNL